MALDLDDFSKMVGYSSLGNAAGGAAGNFIGNKPMDAANRYLNQIPDRTSQYYQPFYEAGAHALPGLQEQYGQLLHDPGARLNQMGESYHQSPGYKFALDQALAASGRAAAAGGMAGSPMHEQQNMGVATGLANQDYYNYLDKATGLYNQGLGGERDFAHMGQQAGTSMADLIAQQLSTQAQQAYEDKAARNQSWSSVFGNVLGSLPFLL